MYRPNISSDLCEEVRARIVDGSLPPDTHLNEVRLAEALAVSRTPLREALSRLIPEGLVVCRPRRGFFTTKLSVDEVEQLYPLRAILDPEALRMAGIPGPELIEELRSINRHLVRARRDPGRVIDLDDRWHRTLLSGCPNRVLLGLIDQMIWRTRRYEYAYMSDTSNVGVATEEHEAITVALEDGELPAACRFLRKNMLSARGPLTIWLRSRESGNDR